MEGSRHNDGCTLRQSYCSCPEEGRHQAVVVEIYLFLHPTAQTLIACCLMVTINVLKNAPLNHRPC